MNFIIDNNNISLKTSNINNLFIDQLKITITTIALFSCLKVYNTYLLGAYGYELNSPSNFPTIKLINVQTILINTFYNKYIQCINVSIIENTY